jgi:hypothetical protein
MVSTGMAGLQPVSILVGRVNDTTTNLLDLDLFFFGARHDLRSRRALFLLVGIIALSVVIKI